MISTANVTDDINVVGSNIIAENDVDLNAGNDINIVAAENTSFEKSSLTEITRGIGIIATENELGVKSSVNFLRDISEGDNLNNVASNVRSGGDVKLNSGNDTNIIGSNVEAGENVDIDTGGDLNILSATDQGSSSHERLEAEIGVKASVSQNITTALKSVGDLFTIGNPLDSVSDMVDFVVQRR